MTDKDVVERAAKIMGSCSVKETERDETRKNIFETYVFGNTAADLMIAIFPYMGVRRQARIGELVVGRQTVSEGGFVLQLTSEKLK